jgi:hypothetical protein
VLVVVSGVVVVGGADVSVVVVGGGGSVITGNGSFVQGSCQVVFPPPGVGRCFKVFDKMTGEFSDVDAAVLVHLAQMASAAVERAQRSRRSG